VSDLQVVESNHTLILGWSEKGIALVQQISLANKSEGGLPIVVLCSENKEEMESMIHSATQRKEDKLQLYGSRVIFRNGNPMNEHDLVRPQPLPYCSLPLSPPFSPPVLSPAV
jgi:ion channel POLLUX/CASTOR